MGGDGLGEGEGVRSGSASLRRGKISAWLMPGPRGRSRLLESRVSRRRLAGTARQRRSLSGGRTPAVHPAIEVGAPSHQPTNAAPLLGAPGWRSSPGARSGHVVQRHALASSERKAESSRAHRWRWWAPIRKSRVASSASSPGSRRNCANPDLRTDRAKSPGLLFPGLRGRRRIWSRPRPAPGLRPTLRDAAATIRPGVHRLSHALNISQWARLSNPPERAPPHVARCGILLASSGKEDDNVPEISFLLGGLPSIPRRGSSSTRSSPRRGSTGRWRASWSRATRTRSAGSFGSPTIRVDGRGRGLRRRRPHGRRPRVPRLPPGIAASPALPGDDPAESAGAPGTPSRALLPLDGAAHRLGVTHGRIAAGQDGIQRSAVVLASLRLVAVVVGAPRCAGACRRRTGIFGRVPRRRPPPPPGSRPTDREGQVLPASFFMFSKLSADISRRRWH